MNALLQSVMQYSPTGLVLFEACRQADGRIVDFRCVLTNPANERNTNRSEEYMTGKTLLEMFPAIVRDEFYGRLVAVIETGEPQQYQHFYKGDGMEAWIDATLVRVEDGVLGSFQNVTALMRQNLELQLARKAAEEAHRIAEQALQVRDIFLANISHEIRTPLNSILGFSELLAEELTDPEHLAYATNIKGAGYTLLKLINNVLDLAKLDANQFELEKQPTSLVEVIGSAATILSARAKQKNLTFNYTGAAELPAMVLSDGLRLTQILMNLGENAVKFTKEGQIDLTVELLKKTQTEAIIALRMADTGIGVLEHRLPFIFDRYQQTSVEITQHYGGTGLGLSIVQSLVQQMGGKISVSSEIGKGTTFTVQIPFALPKAAMVSEVTPDETQVQMPRQPITVLLVEDNPYNQRVVEGLVKRFGVNLLKTDNGLEALRVLRRQSVDLVLMDLQMPLMDGYTTTRHIRQTLRLTVPIVALTANALTHERQNCLSKGMNDYLTKPFTRQGLMLMISQYGQTKANPMPVLVADHPSPSQLDTDLLTDFYDSAWELLESQYDLFEAEWPSQCQLLSDSLANHQATLFAQQAHKFCSTLNALGMIRAADCLTQQSQQFKTKTPAQRSQQMSQFIDDVEQAVAELKTYIEQGKILI